MNVSSFHIQNVIKAYGQRTGKRSLARLKLAKAERPSPDTITISAEAKKKQFIHEITNDLLTMAKGQGRQNYSGHDIIQKIGEKFGEQVDIIPQKNKNTGFKFKVLSKDNEEVIKELSFEDLKKIVENIYEKDGEVK